MNLFTSINEVAVLGTALFMVAFGTIWYSSILFGALWNVHITERTAAVKQHSVLLDIGLTFVVYVLLLTVLASMTVVAPSMQLSSVQFSFLVALIPLACLSLLVIWEQKPISYLMVHGGFIVLFVVSGMFIMQQWPW
jgi:Protein of unknown function (DUF1761)